MLKLPIGGKRLRKLHHNQLIKYAVCWMSMISSGNRQVIRPDREEEADREGQQVRDMDSVLFEAESFKEN